MFMKVLLTKALVILMVAAVVAEAQEVKNEKTVSSEKVQSSAPELIILRGEKIGDSPVVAMSEILEKPDKYENKTIVIEGTVDAVCQKKGCWMVLKPGPDEPAVRVTFKDYGFFVPKDAAGFKVRAEGKIHFTKLSKEECNHLEEDGHKMVREADGTAREVNFVASGVELYQPPATR